MDLQIKVTPDLKTLMKRLGSDITGGLRAGLIHAAEAIEGKAVKGAPVATSNLANAITSSVDDDGEEARVFVSDAAPYGIFVHEGTGLFGPKKQRIRPKKAQALFWPGAAHPVRSIAGMQGRPFLHDAAKATDVSEEFTKGIDQYLSRRRTR